MRLMRPLRRILCWGLSSRKVRGSVAVAFCLCSNAADGALTFHDGREVAPSAARSDMFMSEGEVMPFIDAWQSGKSVGVPGAVALYKQAHDRHGRLPWAQLFQPALQLALEGFEVSPRLAGMLGRMASFTRLDENSGAAEYFYPQGKPLEAGQLRKNPDYAKTLAVLAENGPNAFYTGSIAQAIVAATQAEPEPGLLTLTDLKNYAPTTRSVIWWAV